MHFLDCMVENRASHPPFCKPPVLPGLLAYNRYPPHSYGNLMHRASALGEPHEGTGFHNAPTTRRLGQCYLYMGQWQHPPRGGSLLIVTS